jgi:hypothetical protein
MILYLGSAWEPDLSAVRQAFPSPVISFFIVCSGNAGVRKLLLPCPGRGLSQVPGNKQVGKLLLPKAKSFYLYTGVQNV